LLQYQNNLQMDNFHQIEQGNQTNSWTFMFKFLYFMLVNCTWSLIVKYVLTSW
jgi:hypothetical protein